MNAKSECECLLHRFGRSENCWKNGPQGPSICDLINGVGLVDAQIRRVPAILPDLPHHLANLWLNHQICVFFIRILTAANAQPSDYVRRSQVGELGEQIAVRSHRIIRHLSICEDSKEVLSN